jgi:hypothetical protein
MQQCTTTWTMLPNAVLQEKWILKIDEYQSDTSEQHVHLLLVLISITETSTEETVPLIMVSHMLSAMLSATSSILSDK